MITSDSATRLLDVRMAAVQTPMQVPQKGGVQTWDLRAYQVLGGNTVSPQQPAFPGPTFRVRRGDQVRINLANQLDTAGATGVYSNTQCQPYPAVDSVNPPADTFQDCFHGPNYTNIHYHGFHVTPDSLGDDVLLVIPPGSAFQYDFRIPANQSPGTHWYHPHKHGSVALQVANGMSGTFIVEGGSLDSLTRALGMVDNIVSFQQVDSSLNLLRGAATGPATTLVNGQYFPVVYMRPGEVQRWRFANENYTKTANFVLAFVDSAGDEPSMYDVARDGVQFAPGNYSTSSPDTTLVLAPGQRLDVFVRAPLELGTDYFQVTPPPNPGRQRKPPAGSVTFTVVVVDTPSTPYNTVLPAQLPAQDSFFVGDLPPASPVAVVVFTDSTAWIDSTAASNQAPTNPTHFFLGSVQRPGQQFNDAVVYVPTSATGDSLPMVLGATQTWKILNNSQQKINHPFHIHINPFQVDSVIYPNGTADPFAALYAQLNAASANQAPIWLDVLPLPQPVVDGTGRVSSPAYVVITQRYDPFVACPDCGLPTGQYVMHCHILGHEERGMMQVLQLDPPPGSASAPAVASPARAGGTHRH
ncbi:MAG TPA: multicopper oxidase family protein [Longimicrobiaceae bacterium]|nr:multicopper oxidase family protein [Longimicrobiaceae bacterium]